MLCHAGCILLTLFPSASKCDTMLCLLVYSNFTDPVAYCSKQDTLSKYPDSMPPPYSKIRLDQEMKQWEEKSSANFFDLATIFDNGKEERCSSCFDPIREKDSGTFIGAQRAVREGIRVRVWLKLVDCIRETKSGKATSQSAHESFDARPEKQTGLSTSDFLCELR